MTLHLSREEFAERRRAVRPLAARPLNALPLVQQQSVGWLPPKDTFYGFFRCLARRAGGDVVLLTRPPGLR